MSIGKNVFENCYEINIFMFPNTLSSIGPNAFSSCNSMQGITLPDALERISSEAFSPCESLTYVKMGENVTFVDTSAFCNDEGLATITRFDDENPGHTFDIVGDYAFANTAMKRVNLSLRSSSIYTFWGDYCFANSKLLEEANILSSCYMSTGMFSNCTKLSSVNFKNNFTSYVYPNVFDGCIALSNIVLPSKIWYISEEMFKNCSNLKYVKFNDYSAANSMINLV